MKKIILPIVLALFSFGSVIAQTETPATPAVPQNPEFIQFKTTTHDFGNIKQNIPVSHVFNYKNVGDRDVTINNVQASCGCTILVVHFGTRMCIGGRYEKSWTWVCMSQGAVPVPVVSPGWGGRRDLRPAS